MRDTPVVLINGPRQSGKTTLVKEYSPSLPYSRNAWAKSYIKAIVERDVKDISSIEKLAA